jgi:hypothetical protein
MPKGVAQFARYLAKAAAKAGKRQHFQTTQDASKSTLLSNLHGRLMISRESQTRALNRRRTPKASEAALGKSAGQAGRS